jgi:hypothetical protein
MKQIIYSLICLFMLLGVSITAQAQVSGTVFRDFNANGVKDNGATFNEPFVAGVTVTAYNAVGVATATTTDVNGAYSFTGLTLPLRIEFSGMQTGDYTAPSGSSGTANASSVQFYAAASSTANFAVNAPMHYVSDVANLPIVIPHQWGDSWPAAHLSTHTNESALKKFTENNTGTTPVPSSVATLGQIGNTWGTAYHRKSKTLFASTFFRIFGGYGPGGQSAIYAIKAGTDGTVGTVDDVIGTFIKLDDYFGANSTGVNAFGTIIRGDSTRNGRVSFGDIEMSADGNTLFAMNLGDRKIYSIPLDATASTPALGAITASPAIPSIASCSGVMRPFGMAIRPNGKVYVSAVCENSSSKIYVWGYDPQTNTWDAAPIISFTLANYGTLCCFHGWDNTYSYEAKIMMMGLDFDPSGNFLNITYVNRNTYVQQNRNTGNTIRFCYNGTTWEAENNGTSCGVTGAGVGNSQGPGGGEFYNDTSVEGDYSIMGAAMQIPGRNTFAFTLDDPFSVYTSGVLYANNNNGTQTAKYEVLPSIFVYPPPPSVFDGKRLNLGDIEYLSAPAPIEIGNRLFTDTDRDGIQDAGEAGINGVVVDLYQGATQVATTTTTGDGNYYFNNANVTMNSAAGILPNTAYEVRIPNISGGSKQAAFGTNVLTVRDAGSNDNIDSDASTSGTTAIIAYTTGNAGENNHSLDAGFAPPIPICAGEEYTLTIPAGNTGEWYKDNAATGNTTTTYVVTTAGVYDFRGMSGGCATSSCANATFVAGPCATLGNYVWTDTNRDGLQAGEVGINGVLVELYKETAPGVYTFVRNTTTATNAGTDGYYIFNISEAGNYKVKFPTTSGALILTTQTATAATDGNSDAASDGYSPIVAMNPAGVGVDKDNMTIDAGYKAPVGSVGNYVWFDADDDGTQNESPLSFGLNTMTVELWKETSAGSGVYALAQTTSTTTDGSGNPGYYNFVITESANYYVQFPITYSGNPLAPQVVIAATNNNNDANPTNGKSPVFAINVNGAGIAKDNPTIDAGYRSCGITAGAISGGEVVCATSFDPSPMVSTTDAMATGGYPIEYMWIQSYDNFANHTAAVGIMNQTTYDPPVITQTTYYRRCSRAVGCSAWSIGGESNILIKELRQGITSTVATATNVNCGSAAQLDVTATMVAATFTNPIVAPLTINDNAVSSPAPLYIPISGLPTSGLRLKSVTINGLTHPNPDDIDMVLVSPQTQAVTLMSDAGGSNALSNADVTFQDGSATLPDAGAITAIPYAPADYETGDMGNPTVLTTFTGNMNGDWRFAIYDDAVGGAGSITGLTFVFEATNGITYTWEGSTPAATAAISNVNIKNPTTTVNSSATYTVTITDYFGCTATSSVTPTCIVAVGSVGNYVWNDLDNDGTNNEPASAGINGVDVQLWSTGADNVIGGGDDVQVGANTTTANNGTNDGAYNFIITTSGNYFVKFPTTTNDKVLTTQTTTAATNNNSDANTSTGNSPVFAIDINGTGVAKDNMTIDAGFKCNAVAAITGAPTPCVSPNTVLTATLTSGGSATGYLWDDTTTGATITVSPSISTIYSVTVTAANGCTATTNITVEPLPTVIGISATAKICVGATTTLTGSATGASGYIWNTGALTASIIVGPAMTTLYTVTATYSNGCTASATVNLEVLAVIVINSTAKVDPTTCIPANGSITINATGTVTTALEYNLFKLSTSTLVGAWQSSNVFTGLAADDYSVRVRYVGNKCPIFGSIVSLAPPTPPSPSIAASCSGTNTILTATGASTYLWSTGATTNIITISAAATYTVTATDAGGCIASTIIAATILPCAASLGDRVWDDTNKDGIQDAGEVGVSGITVTLYNSGGTPIAATKTDAYGKYLFSELEPGSYTVGFSLPTNYVFSPKGTGSDSGTTDDSDASTTSGVGFGRSNTIVLTAGEAERNVDAGIYFSKPLTQSIGDYVWFDDNTDGIQDAGEKGVSGVTVTLYNAAGTTILATTITDGNGKYLFADLPTGSYTIGFGQLPGFVFTTQTLGTADGSDVSPSGSGVGKTGIIDLTTAGTHIRDIDAGLKAAPSIKAALGDKVWYDTNNNGIQDAGEAGVAGVKVRLFDATNTAIDSVVTDALGNYLFNNLDAGRYKVQFMTSTLPSGFDFVTQNAGTNDNIDSDCLPSVGGVGGGSTAWYALAPGEKNLTIDAGIHNSTTPLTGGLGNFVWNDADKDGIQDAGESGIGGITVTLYAADGTTVIATTVTDKTGYYAFNNLPAASYIVGFTNTPEGFVFTTQTNGTGTGSDANPSTGKTGLIAITTTFRDDVDAGLYPAGTPSGKGSIGDYVWYDTNDNKIQNAGEVGVQGVTVNLYNNLGAIIATQKTDATGHYLFTGLDKGDYAVGFANLPSGFGFVNQNYAGSTAANDSDANTGTGITGMISLAQGEDNLTIDAGIRNASSPAGAIGNFVWNDINGDGIQNDSPFGGAGGSGVSGVSVVLYAADGVTIVATTTTDANGYYLFPNLPLATYIVGFGNLPDGFVFTTPNAGVADNNSDANVTTGRTNPITLSLGNETNMDIDAGIRSTTKAGLGDYVWLDANGNGIQDSGEKPLSGVTVTLYLSDQTKMAVAVTDANGYYSFINLDPSVDYIVGFSNIPLGANFTTQEASAAANGSDVNPTTGKTGVIHLTAGEFNSTIDSGVTLQKAGLGDYVWLDANGNGIQDGAGVGSEKGVAGVIVILYDETNGGAVIAKTVTDGNGYYSFTNLNPGMYSVEFVLSSLPTGATFTAYTRQTAAMLTQAMAQPRM